MIDDLAPLLRDLPEPAPPSSMTATVMARIEREAEQKAHVKVGVPVSPARELRTWSWTVAGVALVLIAFVNGWLSSGSLPDFASARIGINHAPLMPVGTGVSMLLALGLIAYLAGLFAPLRSVGRD